MIFHSSDYEQKTPGRFPLWRVITPVRGKIIFSMTLSGLAALASLGALLFLAGSLRQLQDTPAVMPLYPLIGMIGCVVLTFVLRLQAFNLSHYAAFRLEKVLRGELACKLVKLSLGELQRMGSGMLVKVIQDDVKSLHIFVADSTPLYVRAVLMPLATMALLFSLDWRLALAALAVLVFGAVVLVLARRSSGEMQQRYHQTREQVSAAVIEFVQAMPVVRTFDSGSSSFGRYQHALENWVAVLKTWYRRAGYSAQDNFLFADTIANNIRLGLPEMSMEAVMAAAKVAQAHDFISALPQGYDTLVGERGVFLSGGQRQRITIARAILQNRPILVLDEATAFADPENEAALIKALLAAMHGKTVIMVAHRLSMVTQADQILVFSQGQLVASGDHAGLLAQGGLYQRLWQQYQQAQQWTPGGAGVAVGEK